MDTRNRNPRLTRRAALAGGIVAAAGLGLGGRLARRVWATPKDDRQPAPAPGTPRATAVIELWMAGGPSHVDTFDPKPDAGSEVTGPFDKPISTTVDGLRICQMMPLLAKQAAHYSVIRSMTHGVNAHETAAYVVQTGRMPGDGQHGVVHPAFGAVLSKLRGREAGYRGRIPPFVMLTRPRGRFAVEGFLGLEHKPFVTGGDPRRDPFAVEGIVLPGVSARRQRSRRELMHALDTLGKASPGNPAFQHLDRTEAEAYDLILGDAGKVFDLTTEPDGVRDLYGRTTFGQSCLVARRLVEQGVPYVTINSGGWDTHKRNFELLRQKLPDLDRGMSALLADLSERGLLERTIVWWSGEFGRTPRVQWDEPWNGGRGHHGACFSSVVAGGGFRGGHVVGATDDQGMAVAENPVQPRDLLRSMYGLLGIDPDAALPNPRGLDVTVLPPRAPGAGPSPLEAIT